MEKKGGGGGGAPHRAHFCHFLADWDI